MLSLSLLLALVNFLAIPIERKGVTGFFLSLTGCSNDMKDLPQERADGYPPKNLSEDGPNVLFTARAGLRESIDKKDLPAGRAFGLIYRKSGLTVLW